MNQEPISRRAASADAREGIPRLQAGEDVNCLKPGPADGQHDCPGLGDIQLSRQLGRGLRVDTAPPRARMVLTVLADHGYGLTMQCADLINIADQVLYQVVAYDPESAALVLELVEDWRPKHTPDAVRQLPERELHATIRKMARIDPAWFRATAQVMDRIDRGANMHAVFGDNPPAQESGGAEEEDEEPTGPAKPGIPRCTATWETEHQGTAHCWRAATHNQREGYEAHMGEAEHGYRFQWIGTEPGTTPHRVDLPLNYECAACRAQAAGLPRAHDELSCVCRDERCESCPPAPDATVCTPIPDATLRQISEVPAELLTEQQLGRPENALERLRLAREALIRDGYFTADEVGPDVAPRIVEWLSHHRDRVAKAETDLAWQQSVNSDLRIESRARGEKLAEVEDQLRRTRIELEHWQTVIAPELRAERDRVRAVLREVLAVFATVTSPTSGTPMGYQAPPIHPDDMARWRAALGPKEQQ